jgi:hypothetical protein
VVARNNYQTDASANADGWILDVDGSGTVAFKRYLGAASDTASVKGGVALPGFHHIVGTYDGSMLRVYVDGTLAATQASTAAMSPTSGPLAIGSGSLGGFNFNGVIDEVALYDKPLGAERVTAHFRAAKL